MGWLLQQNLLRIQIPLLNDFSFTWVKFVTKCKDIVLDQGYLYDSQKFHYLQEHVTGEIITLRQSASQKVPVSENEALPNIIEHHTA